MSNDGVNAGWRRFLVAATSVADVAGAVGATVLLIGSWFPSAGTKAAGVSVQVNMDKIDPGQQIIAEQRGKPVFTAHRTKEILDAPSSLEGRLADPDSKTLEQPKYVDPKFRSIRLELAVTVGICTHLGCSPAPRPEVAPAGLSPGWKGGYFCPCHGSRYDLAGRVCKSQPAPLGLSIPPYTSDVDDVITIDVDQEKA